MFDTTQIAAPLEIHTERVRPEWIDHNGHMNVAFYLMAFDEAAGAVARRPCEGGEARVRGKPRLRLLKAATPGLRAIGELDVDPHIVQAAAHRPVEDVVPVDLLDLLRSSAARLLVPLPGQPRARTTGLSAGSTAIRVL